MGRRSRGLRRYTFLPFLQRLDSAISRHGVKSLALVNHAEICSTKRRSIPINCKTFRNAFRVPAVRVKINKGIDAPFLTKFISRIIIIFRIKTGFFETDIRIQGAEFRKRNQTTNAVMAFRIEEADVTASQYEDFHYCKQSCKGCNRRKWMYLWVSDSGCRRNIYRL